MRIGPAEGSLKRFVKPVEPDAKRHFDLPQYWRANIHERDLKARDRIIRHLLSPSMRLDRLPVRQEFAMVQCIMECDSGENAGEPGPRIDIVELGRLRESIDRGGSRTAAVRAGGRPVAPAESERANHAFRGIFAEAGAAIIDEVGKRRPALQHMVEGLGEIAPGGDASTLRGNPVPNPRSTANSAVEKSPLRYASETLKLSHLSDRCFRRNPMVTASLHSNSSLLVRMLINGTPVS